MGYDINACGSATIPADKVLEAGRAFVIAVRAHEDTDKDWSPDVTTPKAVCALIGHHSELFAPSVEKDGSLLMSAPDDYFRRLDEEEWIFEALGPFFDEGSGFEFTGEDGAKWLWEFNANGVKEVDSALVYGPYIAAPSAVKLIVAALYPDGKLPVDEDQGAVLDSIRNIITESGFGPFAGLTPLATLAEVAEGEES